MIELKKYSREEYDSMLMAQHQLLYKLQKKAGLMKGKKIPESKANNRNNPALDRKRAGTGQSHAGT